MFFICAICARKSFRSNLSPDFIFAASFCASSTLMAFCASSTSDRMSPMPSTRCAIRSGWNGSRPASFSDTPTNFSGLPVT
ncbi:Uncharacterised protein [Mycobacteroides abscessus subsp. abscessus]|nr:Uncharacterised protein [Mycobacteroides abscessus subsp. abscessus]